MLRIAPARGRSIAIAHLVEEAYRGDLADAVHAVTLVKAAGAASVVNWVLARTPPPGTLG